MEIMSDNHDFPLKEKLMNCFSGKGQKCKPVYNNLKLLHEAYLKTNIPRLFPCMFKNIFSFLFK